jgi:hypothetical protein
MATWQRGQAWRAAASLIVLTEAVRRFAPGAIPPATDPNAWGRLADGAHSTGSDHYPHWLTGLGSIAVVTAGDFPHAPSKGLDGYAVTEHMRQARDRRVKYIIFAGRITGPGHTNALGLWIWVTYTGSSDLHYTHFHVSVVGDARADNQAPWSMPGGIVPTPTPAPAGGTNMGGWGQPLGAGYKIPANDYPSQTPESALAWTWIGVDIVRNNTDALLKGQAESAAREQTTAAAVAGLVDVLGKALTAGGTGTPLDTAAVVKAIGDKVDAAGMQAVGAVEALQAALEAKAHAVADALIGDASNGLTEDDRENVVNALVANGAAAPALPDGNPDDDGSRANCDL